MGSGSWAYQKTKARHTEGTLRIRLPRFFAVAILPLVFKCFHHPVGLKPPDRADKLTLFTYPIEDLNGDRLSVGQRVYGEIDENTGAFCYVEKSLLRNEIF